MGTRSLVVFQNGDECNPHGEKTEICVVYRQYDGYPKGRGKELLDFFWNRKLVNGICMEEIKQSNGMFDAVAQWIAYEKNECGYGEHKVGNVYVYPAGTRDCGEEYIYTVSPAPDGFYLTMRDVYGKRDIGAQELKEMLEQD